jgi:diaminopimelate epimerase
MKFYKYQALGNAYIVIEAAAAQVVSIPLVRRLCDRRYGIGSDGVLIDALDAGSAFAVRIFNPDGSEAEKSGNGLRIYARHLWESGRVGSLPFQVSTKGGNVQCTVADAGRAIEVEMGKATFRSADIPVAGAKREVIDEEMVVGSSTVRFTAVSVGNPHCVILTDDIGPERAQRLGPLIERHELFPNRTNVQFVQVIDRSRIRMEIWERGAGYTLASGSSSCAAAAACVRLGLCERSITVSMPGGDLSVVVTPEFAVTMRGPVEKIAEGVLSQEFLAAVAAQPPA